MSKACINCDKRYPGCHSECEVYTRYRQERDKIRKERLKEFDYKDYVSNQLWKERRV